jgi:RNA polymerase sigma-70 factor (ECF subfamily)
LNAPQRRWDVPAADVPAPRIDAPPGLPGQLAQLYEEHFEFVWRNARRLGVPASSAEDVVQDVFVVVHRRLSDFRGGPVRPWIFGILSRVVHDYKRSHRRKASRWVPLGLEAAAGPEHEQHSPSDCFERAERARLMDALLDQLSEEQRTLIVLAELEQWTLREIAESLGSNINTVYARLRVAKQRFEKAYLRALAKLGGEP